MNWKNFWDRRAQLQEPLGQVARLRAGKILDDGLMQRIAEKIRKQLEIQPGDEVLDVCCGNGILTHLIAPYCRSITGVDLSGQQIGQARLRHVGGNMKFHQVDAATFRLDRKFDKILLYFSFQYFESAATGMKVISNLLQHLRPGGMILLGDIPDAGRIRNYYPGFPDRMKYRIRFALGRSDMGKFWSDEELHAICKKLKVPGRPMQQESWQPYSDYRFDYIIYSGAGK